MREESKTVRTVFAAEVLSGGISEKAIKHWRKQPSQGLAAEIATCGCT